MNDTLLGTVLDCSQPATHKQKNKIKTNRPHFQEAISHWYRQQIDILLRNQFAHIGRLLKILSKDSPQLMDKIGSKKNLVEVEWSFSQLFCDKKQIHSN